MDGMNFDRRSHRPEPDEDGALAATQRHAARALAAYALVVLATLAVIVALDALGLRLPVSDFAAGL